MKGDTLYHLGHRVDEDGHILSLGYAVRVLDDKGDYADVIDSGGRIWKNVGRHTLSPMPPAFIRGSAVSCRKPTKGERFGLISKPEDWLYVLDAEHAGPNTEILYRCVTGNVFVSMILDNENDIGDDDEFWLLYKREIQAI